MFSCFCCHVYCPFLFHYTECFSVRQIGYRGNSALVTSVEKLALNMEIMAKEQQEQGKRLETLEARDGEMWRKVVGYIVTAIVGGVIGFIFTRLGM